MKKILVTFGTRPEVIKLAPVIKKLEQDFELRLLHTGQHLDLVTPMLNIFDLVPDIELKVMSPGQDLSGLTQSLLPSLAEVLKRESPDYVMVQGDTTTSYLTALAAYYHQIPVLHVEAGLRSHDPYFPFPEEMNRKQISHLAHLHFAPTINNKNNLLREGIDEDHIFVTGNTVIDALNFIQNSSSFTNAAPALLKEIDPEEKLIVLTAHRRENHGKPLQDILEAIKLLLSEHEDLKVIFPVHPNPEVTKAIGQVSITHARFIQTEPLDYLAFQHVLRRADLVLSDSGGIQEESSALGKYVLVLREQTERQELIEEGMGELTGHNTSLIVEAANFRLRDLQTKISETSLFGNGKAAEKIHAALIGQL